MFIQKQPHKKKIVLVKKQSFKLQIENTDYFPLNLEIIQNTIATSIIIPIIAVYAPALKMSPITEHPLRATIAITNTNKFNFFIG